ncbi:MAG: contractile injection system tape measure protein [Ginsengibacter sp.]
MKNHIIHTQNVQLQTGKFDDAFELQNRVSNLLKNGVMDKLESLFDEVAPNENILRFDKLELNLGNINKQNLETEFSQKLIEQLSRVLLEMKNDDFETGSNQSSHQQSLLDSLIFFLIHGYMPWYHVVKPFAEWEKDLLGSFSKNEWDAIIKELKNNDDAIRRLVMQFSSPFLETILFEIHAALNKQKIQSFLERFNNKFDVIKKNYSNLFWMKTIKSALDTASENDFTITLLKSIDKGDKSLEKNQESIDQPEGDFFIPNCGIVILHPFLLMFFRELGLVEENTFKSDEKKQRAVLLLHYLATGETEMPEFNLTLCKLLCGVDIEEPVPNFIELTELEINESANLLKAVTQHWVPLHNTSAEGLRSSFFSREGKITPTENGWILKVEQKAIDILLDKLPWGIGTIKLPWMKKTLNVEWC